MEYTYRTILFIQLIRQFFVSCSSSENDSGIDTAIQIKTSTIQKTNLFSEVIAGGTITNETNTNIIEKGVVWSTSANARVTDSKLVASGSGNVFNVTITGLQAATNYYINAYVFDGNEVVYGSEQQITTDEEQSEVAFLPSAGDNKQWTLQAKFSNEFDYEGGKAAPEFTENWQDRFFNGWTGARKTVYSAQQS